MPATHVQPLSLAEIKDAPTETISYSLEKISIRNAQHRDAAKDAASVFLSIIQIEFTTKLEPSLIQPTFSNNPRAFRFLLPTPLAEAAKRLALTYGFQAQQTTCKYLLKLEKNAMIAPRNAVQPDSFLFVWISLPQGYSEKDSVTQEEMAKHLAKAGLDLKTFYHQTDRESGTLLPRCRITFDLNDHFNTFMLRHILHIKLPGAFQTRLSFSPTFCTTYKLHRECLRFMRNYGCPKEEGMVAAGDLPCLFGASSRSTREGGMNRTQMSKC